MKNHFPINQLVFKNVIEKEYFLIQHVHTDNKLSIKNRS